MKRRSLLSAVLCLLAPTAVHAATPLSPLAPLPAGFTEDDLTHCPELPDSATFLAVPAGSARALQATSGKGRTLLWFEGSACFGYPIGVAAARGFGRFLVGGRAGKAFALGTAHCGSDACFTVVVVRAAKDEKPLAAFRLAATCDAGVRLMPLKLFADHDSIEVVCRSSSGAGSREEWTMLDAVVVPGALTVLARVDAGSVETPSAAERAAGRCAAHPVGGIAVIGRGARPTLRLLDLTGASLHDGKGTLVPRDVTWDADQRAFLPSGKGRPVKVDARSPCGRK